jgi:hypothetical protein
MRTVAKITFISLAVIVVLLFIIQGFYILTGPHYNDQSYFEEMSKCAALVHHHCS